MTDSNNSIPCLLWIHQDPSQPPEHAVKHCLHTISSYIIIDLVGDSLGEQLGALEGEIPGVIIRNLPWRGIGAAIEMALPIAKEWSDSLLWLDQNEELLVLSNQAQSHFQLGQDEPAAQLLVTTGRLSFAELRLFNTRLPISVQGEVLPLVMSSYVDANLSLRTMPHFIRIEKTGAGEQQPLDREAVLLAEIATYPMHANQLSIACALEKLKQGDVHAAQQTILNPALDFASQNDELRWTRDYLLGVTAQASNQLNEAIEYYQAAIDINSEKIEAYARLIEICLTLQNYDAAADLAEVAEELSWFDGSIYAEVGLYGRDFLAIRLRALAKAERRPAASKLAHLIMPQLSKTDLMQTALVEYEQMRAPIPKAAEHKAKAKPTKENTIVEQRSPKLTIGMATFDDFDGVYFTVMSILLFHQECLDEIELLIIDNNPSSEHGKAVADLANKVKIRYIPAAEFKGTTVRERVFLEARGDFVMCVDCHVFLHQGVIARLLNYISEHPDSKDIWHGPLVSEDIGTISTHMTERWQQGFFGVFEHNNRAKDPEGEPFEIPMQGLALFVCKRTNWAGFNRKFRGFGGEEGYIHYKFALAGGKTWCLPFLRWTHRFPRPNGVKYENRWEHRVRNYLLGWTEIGRDTQSIYDHYSEQLGAREVGKIHRALQAEMASPFWDFDSVYQLNSQPTLWDNSKDFYADWGLSMSMQKIDCANSIEGIKSGLLSVLKLARSQSLPSVLILIGQQTEPRSSKSSLVNWLHQCRHAQELSIYQQSHEAQFIVCIPAAQYGACEAQLKLHQSPNSDDNPQSSTGAIQNDPSAAQVIDLIEFIKVKS